MKLYLTNHMFGDRIKQIGDETENVKTILEHVYCWKNDEENRKNFKIEPYDRLIFKDTEIAIDFGDYCTFMLITDVDEAAKDQFQHL